MKVRVFKNEDGSVVYNTPATKYQGGHFVPDLTQPVHGEIADPTRPIINKKDGKIVGYHNKKVLIGYKPKELKIEDCRIPKSLEGLPFVLMEDSDLPPSDSRTGNYHEMIHFDGDCCPTKLKQDKTWENRLMPGFLVKEKEKVRLQKDLDLMFDQQSPDQLAIVRLHRKIDKVKSLDWKNEHQTIAEIALAGLDRADIKKPLIRKKLEAKLAGLRAKKDSK